jgi:hypothetical protein
MREHPQWVHTIEIILGSVNIAACISIFIHYYLQKVHAFAFELLLYYVFANMAATTSYFINFIEDTSADNLNGIMCKTQASLMMVFQPSLSIWMIQMSWFLYNNSHDNQINGGEKHKCKKRVIYSLVGFGIPILYATVSNLLGITGPNGMWCWIESTYDITINTYFAIGEYSLIWIAITLAITLCCLARCKMRGRFPESQLRGSIYKFSEGLCIIIFITAIFKLIGTLNRFVKFFDDEEYLWLEIIHALSIQLLGLVIALIIWPFFKNLLVEQKKISSQQTQKKHFDFSDTENGLTEAETRTQNAPLLEL